MSMKEEEMIEKLRKEVEIPDKVRQKANEAFASIKKDAGAGAAEERAAERRTGAECRGKSFGFWLRQPFLPSVRLPRAQQLI